MKIQKISILASGILLAGSAISEAKVFLKIKNANENLEIIVKPGVGFCGPWKETNVRFKNDRTCLENNIKFRGASKPEDYFKFDLIPRKKNFTEIKSINWQEIDRSQESSGGKTIMRVCKAVVNPLFKSRDGEIAFDSGCQVQIKNVETTSIYFDEADQKWKYASLCNEQGTCVDLKNPEKLEMYKNQLPDIDTILAG